MRGRLNENNFFTSAGPVRTVVMKVRKLFMLTFIRVYSAFQPRPSPSLSNDLCSPSLPPPTFSDFQTFSDYLSSPFVMYNIMVRLLVHPSAVGVRDRRFSPEAVVVIVPLSTIALSPVLSSSVSCAPTTALKSTRCIWRGGLMMIRRGRSKKSSCPVGRIRSLSIRSTVFYCFFLPNRKSWIYIYIK